MQVWTDYKDDLQYFRTKLTRKRVGVVALIAVVLAFGFGGWTIYQRETTKTITAYFANTNGLYAGDDVKVMGVPVGTIKSISPDGSQMKVVLQVGGGTAIPANAEAVIVSPTLVSSRFVQLTPAYSGGAQLADGAAIPLSRTAVPVEWDDFRAQLQQLSSALGSDAEGNRGPLGNMLASSAEALDGKGQAINDTINQLANATATLSDGRKDLFGTIRNLQVFTAALASSGKQMAQFNEDLATVTELMSNSDNELSDAISGIDAVIGDVTTFVGNNRDQLAHSVAGLQRVTSSLRQSQPDIEQLLHVGPNAFANFYNIYQPAQGTLTGALSITQFQNPIQFVCGAIQSASGLGAKESAQRCAQYLGPVLKNLAFNYPPVGVNPLKGVQARPEQIDYEILSRSVDEVVSGSLLLVG